MGANSGIEWTDHTFNPWIGCTKVSPGCDHCYAESYANRYGKAVWGSGKPRQLTSESNWKQPLKWNHEAMTTGIRRRVFCASLADVFDNEVDSAWRTRLWNIINSTRHLDWLLLTKRIGNVAKMLPPEWGYGWPNVWLGISVVNQEEADRDIPRFLSVPSHAHFLSMEPLLGPVKLPGLQCEGCGYTEADKRFQLDHHLCKNPTPTLDWVIVGGESGRDARPMQLEWAKSLRDQCQAAGVPFFFKQWGEWAPILSAGIHSSLPYRDGMVRFGKKQAGRLLEEREWNEVPLVAA